MSTPSLRFKNMHFKNVNVKDPSDKFMVWLGEVKLPKSNYLNKSTRGKQLLTLPIETVEYIGWSCKQCNPLLKRQAKYLYFIMLYPQISEHDISEEEFDEVVAEELKIVKEKA